MKSPVNIQIAAMLHVGQTRIESEAQAHAARTEALAPWNVYRGKSTPSTYLIEQHMIKEAPIDPKVLFAEMQSLAQTVIIEWFANVLRVRIATQSPAQRALNVAILQDGLDEALSRHETQTLPGSLSQQDALKASLFKEAFMGMSGKLMTTIGGGLTNEEKATMT